MYRNVKYKKIEQNFNPGLMLIGLSGTRPRKTILFGFPMLLSAVNTFTWNTFAIK